MSAVANHAKERNEDGLKDNIMKNLILAFKDKPHYHVGFSSIFFLGLQIEALLEFQ